MDGVLDDFLEDSGMSPINERRKKRKKGSKSEGIWVRCKGVSADSEVEGYPNEGDEEDTDEDDESIWWTWDGKIVGFSDW